MLQWLKHGLWQWRRPVLVFFGTLVCTLLLAAGHLSSTPRALAQNPAPAADPVSSQLSDVLPQPMVHPLPPTLAQWQDVENQGDYFSEIRPSPVGYLVWSTFPIRIFIEPASLTVHVSARLNTTLDTTNTTSNEEDLDRAQRWIDAVSQAIEEWNIYLPLEVVGTSDGADIAIWRTTPPIQGLSRPSREGSTGEDSPQAEENRLPRIRSAETRYQLFIRRPPDAPSKLAHRFILQISPNQTTDYIKATARHEIGHALGIWGHSPIETDVLYFSQVRHPPIISVRDVNTLKRIYEQPTQVGWELERP